MKIVLIKVREKLNKYVNCMTVPRPPNVCLIKNADRDVGFHRHIPHNCFCQSFQDTGEKLKAPKSLKCKTTQPCMSDANTVHLS